MLNVYELSKGELKSALELEAATPHGIKCATFGASRLEERHIAIGDYGGTLRLCDLERAVGNTNKSSDDTVPSIFSAQAHSGIINAIDGIGGLAPPQIP